MLHKLVLQHNLYTIEKLQFKTRSEGLISSGQLPSKIFIFQSRARAHNPYAQNHFEVIWGQFWVSIGQTWKRWISWDSLAFTEILWNSLRFIEIHWNSAKFTENPHDAKSLLDDILDKTVQLIASYTLETISIQQIHATRNFRSQNSP